MARLPQPTAIRSIFNSRGKRFVFKHWDEDGEGEHGEGMQKNNKIRGENKDEGVLGEVRTHFYIGNL